MKVTYERREGRITVNEYRASVDLGGGRVVMGGWQYTKRLAKVELDAALRRDVEANGEARLAAESARRMAATRTKLDTDRRVNDAA